MKFTKMQGCGNDYVYVNGLVEKIPEEKKPELVRRLSDRHFGIGGDGVIFILPSKEADFEMQMFNADGTRAQMCGNGIRCVGKFVYDKGLTDKKKITVVSAGSVKYLELMTEKPKAGGPEVVTRVRVDMGSPILLPEQIPVKAAGERVVDEPITVCGQEYRMTCVSMGNPHAVIFAEGVAELDLEKTGPFFENHECFPERTNTENTHDSQKSSGQKPCIYARVGERNRRNACMRNRLLRYGGGMCLKRSDGGNGYSKAFRR